MLKLCSRFFATFNQKPQNPELFLKWKESGTFREVVLKQGIRLKFELPASDLEEQFMKGFGPGGQKTNKSNNCVVLKHIPTGEVVKCHDSREQHANRGIAKNLLIERLDLFLNEDTSKVGLRTAKVVKKKEKVLYR